MFFDASFIINSLNLNCAGFICFKASGDVIGSEESVVMLSIGQFRKVIKNAEKLITLAEENKILHEAENE